jgi:hypothetical protein
VGDEDAYKEESRKFRRTYFGFEQWKAHRSSSRYVRHLAGLFGSRIVRGLGAPLGIVLAAGAATGGYETALEAGLLPVSLPSVAVGASSAAQVSAFALSLLLASRTTNSYARWQEASTLAGTTCARALDLVRQAHAWLPPASPPDAAARDAVTRWAALLPRALAAHVTEDAPLVPAARAAPSRLRLRPAELAAVAASPDAPRFALAALSAALDAAPSLTQAQRARLDEGLSTVNDAVVAAERILRQPIPLSYTRHTSRVLVISLAFLPAVLWPECRWGAVPASALIAFLLLGIDEIGVALEEPWSILPFASLTLQTDNQLLATVAAAAEARRLAAGGWGDAAATASADESEGEGGGGDGVAGRLFRGIRAPSFFKA